MSDGLLAADPAAEPTEPASPAPEQATTEAKAEPKQPEKSLYKEEAPKEEPKPEGEAETKEESKAEEKPPKEETKEPEKKAPESYEWKTPEGMPEGFERDPEVFDALEEVAREIDLSQEEAQTLVDKLLPTMHRRAAEQEAAVHEQWVEQVKADKEIGGDKLDENLATAKKAVKAYASAEMQELLNGPLGSHPAVVRFLVNVGRTVSEDKFVSGERREQPIDPRDDAAVARKLYPHSAQA